MLINKVYECAARGCRSLYKAQHLHSAPAGRARFSEFEVRAYLLNQFEIVLKTNIEVVSYLNDVDRTRVWKTKLCFN